MIHAKFAPPFWGESIFTAIYLINKLPSVGLHWKSPFEILFGKPPSFDHLRIVGCLVYGALLKPMINLPPFPPLGKKTGFYWFPTNQKGYKLCDLATNEILLSRDVTFFENTFPFH